MYPNMRGFMTELNIKEYDLDVRAVNEMVLSSNEIFGQSDCFGNLDASMQEIDAAIMKLQKLSCNRDLVVLSGI